jgi:hypothetical protein
VQVIQSSSIKTKVASIELWTNHSTGYCRYAGTAANADTIPYRFRTEAAFTKVINITAPPEGPPRHEVPTGSYGYLGAVPSSFNWCNESGCTSRKIQDACWTFSAVAAFESTIKIIDDYDSNLSEQYPLQCKSDNWICKGGMWAHDYHRVQQSETKMKQARSWKVIFSTSARI